MYSMYPAERKGIGNRAHLLAVLVHQPPVADAALIRSLRLRLRRRHAMMSIG